MTVKRKDGSEETKETTFMPKNYFDLQVAFAIRFPKDKSLMVIQRASSQQVVGPNVTKNSFRVGERIIFREFQDSEKYENFQKFMKEFHNKSKNNDDIMDNILFEEDYKEKLGLRKKEAWKLH